jgi:hypothetical protein
MSDNTKMELIDASNGEVILHKDKIKVDINTGTMNVDYCACSCYYKKPVYFRMTSTPANQVV